MKLASQYKELSDKHVLEIRKLYASGAYTQMDLAQLYKVSQAEVSAIVLNKIRVNVGGYYTKHVMREFPTYFCRIVSFAKNSNKLATKLSNGRFSYHRDKVVKLVNLYRLIDEGALINCVKAAEIIGLTHQRVHQFKSKFTTIIVGDTSYLYRCEVVAFAELRKLKKRDIVFPKVSNPVESFPY